MVKLADNNGAMALIGLPIPCDDLEENRLLALYLEVMQTYAAENEIVVIDFYSAMVDESGVGIKAGFHVDGVHPNEAGYKVMAEVTIDVLRSKIVRYDGCKRGQ